MGTSTILTLLDLKGIVDKLVEEGYGKHEIFVLNNRKAVVETHNSPDNKKFFVIAEEGSKD